MNRTRSESLAFLALPVLWVLSGPGCSSGQEGGQDAPDAVTPDGAEGTDGQPETPGDGLPDTPAEVPDAADVEAADDGVEDIVPDDIQPDPPADPDVSDVEDAPEEIPTGSVLPYDGCVGGDPRAKFIDETPPAATVQTHEVIDVSVTFANCGGETWDIANFKLGSQSPQDNFTWGAGRIPLPGDVHPNEMAVIRFPVIAPDIIGSFGYRWGIVHEGVEWLTDTFSPDHAITVVAAVSTVEICPGVSAELGGLTSATSQLQACIDATPEGGTLEIPAGVYLMTGAVSIARGMTLATRGTSGSTTGCLLPGAPACAVLMAAADLDTDNGFLQILDSSSNVTVSHIILDGNRATRLGSAAAATCASGNNRRGFNSFARGTGHRFTYNASVRALCGTGMEWRGGSAVISGNYFGGNGDNSTTNMWSDGLTIHEADGSTIENNTLWNNSDVSLILGGGAGTTVRGNVLMQTTQRAFAALMLDNFNGGTSGNFTGSLVTGNTINCTTLLCDFGINLGPHAWYLSANILGGEVTGNAVAYGKICLNIDGAGTVASPITVYGNTLAGSPSSAAFNCGTRSTSNFNIGPDSVVNLNGDPTPYTTYEWHGCP